jgi:Flp pilus assembly protein TadB
MADHCEECIEVRKLKFQIEGLDISLQKNKIQVEGIRTQQEARDIEHEAMIQNLSTRMDSMEQKFDELKKEVKTDIASIKEEIPSLFKSAVNELMARVFKYIMLGLLSIIALVVLAIVLAFTRPYIVESLKELTQKVEQFDVTR